MQELYLKCATRIIGELEVRYNWASAKNNPREVVINLWANELTQIVPTALTPQLIRKAINEWDIDSNNKPPLVGQFMLILKRLTNDLQHRQRLALEAKQTQSIDWIDMFNRADNKGKFQFFMRNRKTSPVTKVYAKGWFNEFTKFNNDQIHCLINGKLI